MTAHRRPPRRPPTRRPLRTPTHRPPRRCLAARPSARRAIPRVAFVTAGLALLAVAALVVASLLYGWIKPLSPAQPAHTITSLPVTVTGPVGAPGTATLPQTATFSPSVPSVPTPDVAELQAMMLELINADRSTERLPPVQWDDIAARAGMEHVTEMAAYDYFSHWDLSGYGPDYRYTQAGGLDTVMENIYTYWYGYDDGRPAPISDWEKVVIEAQESLIQSPVHRKNILDPYHTHVGIGIAYNQASGEVKITQEFVNRYVSVQPLPRKAFLGAQVILQGRLLPSVTEPMVNMAFEPFPEPMTTAELDAMGTFISSAETYTVVNPEVKDNLFTARLTFDHDGQPGLYHVRVWVKVNAQEVLASEIVVEVR